MVRGTGYVAAAALAVSGVCVSAFSPSSPSTSTIIRPRITPTKPLHASFPQAQRTTALNLSSEAEELVKSQKSKDAEDTTATGSAMQLETLQGSGIDVRDEENWELDSKVVELAGLGIWMVGLSGFIFANNWIGPWPLFMKDIPERVFFTGHMLGGMLFGGGIIMTTALEWLVTKNKNPAVLMFYFDKVPLLDMALVLPGLTLAMFSGTGLTITRYGGLGIARDVDPSAERGRELAPVDCHGAREHLRGASRVIRRALGGPGAPPPASGGTRRVRLVRKEGRDVSS